MTLAASFAARRLRWERRRVLREMGICPSCAVYLGAHKIFGHGVSRWQ